jgi:hypothetical protein
MANLVTLSYNNIPVLFQSDDAYLNATQIAKQFNKKTENYLRTDSTKEYLIALEKHLSSVTPKSATEQNQLVRVIQGGKSDGQGTWLHPKLSIHFARWLNADFGVWCDMEIEKMLKSKQTVSVPQSFSEALILAGKLQAEKEAAEAKVIALTTVIDNEFGYSSILRASKFLGVGEKELKWQTLKAVTLGLGLEVKRVPSPRYEYQLLYPIKAFQIAYPDYDFDDLKPELHDDKLELAYL